ncbi:MAG: hypothetical protein ACM3KR_06295 [Deltaproteobacteria bacterium]
MKISESSIAMSANTIQSKTYTKKESLNYWIDGIKDNNQNSNQDGSNSLIPGLDSLMISEEGKNKVVIQPPSAMEIAADDNLLDISDQDKQKIMILERMLKYLTGKDIKIIIPKKILDKDKCANALQAEFNRSIPQEPQKKGWGLSYDFKETYAESQKMSFKAAGVVKTQDGREINFTSELNMSRQFISDKEIHIRAGDAKIDPLVINFDGLGANLEPNRNFVFDIDTDGEKENLNFVDKNSGFLVLDKNNDGKINDGSELFGPKTNDGFSELAEYDADANGWIDENDPIFDKLKIWTKDENGNDVLFALGQKGVGAIYLGNVSTDFDIKDSSNQALGSVAKTGIYLKEDGKSGIIQHIDLSI